MSGSRHRIFVYETFLYIVAALLRTRRFDDLYNIFTSHYIVPTSERYDGGRFERFDEFYGYSETLNSVLAIDGKRYLSAAAELIKRQASRADITFRDIMEAELLVLLMAFITPDTRWYPQTLYYAATRPIFRSSSERRSISISRSSQ